MTTFDMMMDIKARKERGFYQRSAIQFDLSRNLEIISRYKPTPAQLAAVLPANLPTSGVGRRIELEIRSPTSLPFPSRCDKSWFVKELSGIHPASVTLRPVLSRSI
ncbi:MAG: hypothetical protein E5V29_27165 [Mesorhizobium sp.]|nr:MAG: hypothetical protein E5V29_27165 [Mesorhizobium sp.]